MISAQHVRAVLASRGVEHPLTSEEIADLCTAAYPLDGPVYSMTVRTWLRHLHRRGWVTRLSGRHDADELRRLGLDDPDPRHTYWMLAALRHGRYAYPHHEE